MTESTIASATGRDAHGVLEGVPLPRRNGARGLLPSTWLGRDLRLEYTDAHGSGQETSGVFLDWCPIGPVLNIRGGRTIIPWDRLCLVELSEG